VKRMTSADSKCVFREMTTYPFILATDRESVTGYAPRDGQCVELLHVLSAPDIGAGKPLQDWSLVLNNTIAITLVLWSIYRNILYLREHHDPVHDSADNTPYDLNTESMSWSQVDILSQLEIS